MHRFLLFSVMLLTACGLRLPPGELPTPLVPDDLLRGCEGYLGPKPKSEGQVMAAAAAEKNGRLCANAKLDTVRQILLVE